VFVRSTGAVTPAGTGVPALVRALADPGFQAELGLPRPDAGPLPVAVCRDFSTAGVLSPLVARRLDRPSRLLAVAAREALLGEGDPLPWPRDRVGVTAGTWNAGTSALVEVLRAVFLASPEEAPPAQFPSTVANAPASQLGIIEKLAGPNLTFAEKQVGGLRAITEGVRMLAAGRADAVLACGVDEGNWLNAEGYFRLGTLRTDRSAGMVLCEGAVALVLSREAGPAPLAAVAGWASAGALAPPYAYPGDPAPLAETCARAIARAGLAPGDVDLVVSMANGIPALTELELAALTALTGSHTPAAIGVADRLGDGAAGGTIRALVAALAVGGAVRPAWPLPSHLREAGFRPLAGRPRTALVAGVAGGGSTLALVLTAV
jgi:3-oxoacyl-[acyl-carrier-protein] synthase II